MLQATQPDPDQDLLEQLDRRERWSWLVAAGLASGEALVIGVGAFALMRYAIGWRLETALDVAMLIFAGAATALGLRAFSRR
jgi:hypothetical protein